MPTYQTQNLGASISGVVQADDGQDAAIRSFERGNTEPGVREVGLLWLCTDTTRLSSLGLSSVPEAFLQWTGSAWRVFAVTGSPQLNAAGTVQPTADLPMNSRKLTNLGAGTNPNDSVRRAQVVLLDGSQAFTGAQSMGGFKLTNLAAPTNPNDAARLADLASAVGVPRKLRLVNSDSTELFTKHPFGGTISQFTRRFHQMPGNVKPRHVRGVFKFRANLSTNYARVGILDPAGNFDVPLWEPQSDNGATFSIDETVGMCRGYVSSGTWAVENVRLRWSYVPSPLGLASGYVVESNQVQLSNSNSTAVGIRFYIEWFHNNYSLDSFSNASGFLFYARRASDGQLIEFDEFGGGQAGVLQLQAEGWD
jgi:hypothetical protein